MLINMLRAVSKMLNTEGCGDAATIVLKVSCAKTVLDEVILNLETQKEIKDYYQELKEAVTTMKETPNPISNVKTKPETKSTLELRPEITVDGENEWMITLDEGGGLKIVDFPVDGLIELDGKKMPYSEARGMKFKKARIL